MQINHFDRTQVTKNESLPHADMGSKLRNYACLLMAAASLAGCDDPKPVPFISAEEFRTNFTKYAGQKVEFHAYARSQAVATNGSLITYQVDFFSDPEHSLKVASTVTTEKLTRESQLVTVPVLSINEGRGVHIAWLDAKFASVEDPAKPVDTSSVDAFVKEKYTQEQK